MLTNEADVLGLRGDAGRVATHRSTTCNPTPNLATIATCGCSSMIILRDAHIRELLNELGLLNDAASESGTVIILAH